MNHPASRFKMIVIGGNEDLQRECTILKEFVRLAGGSRARLLVLTVAVRDPKAMAGSYLKVFRRLGAKHLQNIDIVTRQDTHAADTCQALERATGVFFCAGDQLDVTSLLGGTELDKILRRRSDRGTVLAGTDVGAAMLSHAMITDASSRSSPLAGTVCLSPGLGFLSGSIVETHFAQRARHSRLLSAIAQYPHDLGIGIDENTAITLSAQRFHVTGEGSVTVIDVGAATFSNASEAYQEMPLALHNIRVHVLPAGHGFDLETRTPLPPVRLTRRPAKTETAPARPRPWRKKSPR